MHRSARASLCSPTVDVRGRAVRRRAARRHRRGRVQHRADRLPGDRSPTRATPGRSSRSPTRTSATTASTPPTSSRAGCSAAASSSASWPAAQQPPRRGRPRRDAARATAIPGITGIDTRRLTRLIRDTGAMPGAFGPAERRRRRRPPPPPPSPAPTASTSSPPSPRAEPVHGRRPATARRIVAYDYGIKRTILRHLAALGTVEVVPADDAGRRRAGAASPTASSCPTGPGDPACVAGAVDELSRTPAGCLRRARSARRGRG